MDLLNKLNSLKMDKDFDGKSKSYRPPSRRGSSASQKLKDFFSFCGRDQQLESYHDTLSEHQTSNTRPSTASSIASSVFLAMKNIIAKTDQQSNEKKAVKATTKKANAIGRGLGKESDIARPCTPSLYHQNLDVEEKKAKDVNASPPLRHKSKFSNDNTQLWDLTPNFRPFTSDSWQSAEKSTQRKMFSSKNQESIFWPSDLSNGVSCSPRSSRGSSQQAATSDCSSPRNLRHKRSSSLVESTAAKFNSYISNSAELLDTTRREIVSTVRKTTKRAIQHTLDYHERRILIDDSDSDDESFYCIGERRLSELSRDRRLSDCATNPWVDSPQQTCRLCRKQKPGIAGLCHKCQNAFYRPRTSISSNRVNMDELRPTPPLKTRNTNPSGRIADRSGEFISSDLSEIMSAVPAHDIPQPRSYGVENQMTTANSTNISQCTPEQPSASSPISSRPKFVSDTRDGSWWSSEFQDGPDSMGKEKGEMSEGCEKFGNVGGRLSDRSFANLIPISRFNTAATEIPEISPRLSAGRTPATESINRRVSHDSVFVHLYHDVLKECGSKGTIASKSSVRTIASSDNK